MNLKRKPNPRCENSRIWWFNFSYEHLRCALYKLALACLALLAGCGPIDQGYGPKPGDPKPLVASWTRVYLPDPHSLRNVSLTDPVEGTTDFRNGWIVCFGANWRNERGAYQGLTFWSFLIRDDKIIRAEKNPPVCANRIMTYHTWPELEGR